MTELFVLLIGLAACAVVLLPLLREQRRPWLVTEVSGEGEALRQEELTALEALRDLTMDFKLGNLSGSDYHALAAPLQTRLKHTQALQAEHQQLEIEDAVVDADWDQFLEAEIQAARRVSVQTVGGAARFCHQCGHGIEKHHRFCPGCGTSLQTSSPAASESAAGQAGPMKTSIAAATKSARVEAAPPGASVNGIKPASLSAPHPLVQGAASNSASAGKSRRQWLWWGTGVVAVIWVAVVIGIYVNARNSQTANTPLAQFDAPIETITTAGDSLLLGTRAGLQHSSDGRSWSGTGLAEPVLTAAALDEAGTQWLASTMTGLRQSLDSGATWQALTPDEGEDAPGFVDLAALPPMGIVWGLTEEALYGSEDGGITWTLLSNELPGRGRALAVGPGLIYVGTDQGVFASGDGGRNWSSQNGSVNGRIVSLDVRSLAFDAVSGMLYAGTPVGLSFLNTDVGGGWGQRSLTGVVTSLRLDGQNNQVLWVGTQDGRLFRSPNRGVSWQ
ncbi:MAG: hypothetical protein KDD84_10980 [Caldilineaceae bacterium]|nr:hypothetical protein [Caldilineaceae bacterium]